MGNGRQGLERMTLGTRGSMVEVCAPCDPSRWCMRYSGIKGCCLSCLDPRHVHICPTTIIPAAAPEGTGQSPCRPSSCDHGPFRHPDPCQALPQSDGSPVARAHVMRIAMQGQQLCLQPQVSIPRTVPRLRVSRDCKHGRDSQIPLSVPVLGSATSSSAPLGVITT